jgi:hypothetical protein
MHPEVSDPPYWPRVSHGLLLFFKKAKQKTLSPILFGAMLYTTRVKFAGHILGYF